MKPLVEGHLMKLLVTGGRDFDDCEMLFRTLDAINSESVIRHLIHGAARGADYLAGQWAKENAIEEIACPADWKQHGRAAGPIRNKFMLEQHQPDLVVAFPGGRGTANMVGLAERAGTKVLIADQS